MSKFYYPASRAHHAYVMALDFGMKFSKREGFWTPEGLLTVTGAGGYKIEIAEESLGLLEPRVGDLCRLQWLDGSTSVREWEAEDELPVAALDRDVRVPPLVIQRDGKLFHWPEQEKAEGAE